MKNDDEKYIIVYSIDDNYFKYFLTSLYSLLDNTFVNIKIYLLFDDISINNKYIIDAIKEKVEINEIYIDIKNLYNLKTSDHFTIANYYRLLIPDYVDGDKALYLDADLIVNGNIKDIYEQNIDDYYVAAVEDPCCQYHEYLLTDSDAKYFNSGVMLINLKKWREFNIKEKVIEYINKYPDRIKYVDQCGLNAVINGEWKSLPLHMNQQSFIYEKYFNYNNYYNINDYKKALCEPIIVHYTGSSKPWEYNNKHKYKYLYWKYAKKTPFYREQLVNNLKNRILHVPRSFKRRFLRLFD